MQQDSVTVVLTTHYLDEAEQLAHRVGIISRGRLIAEGDPVDLMHTGTRATFAAAPGLPVGKIDGMSITEIEPGKYLVESEEVTPQAIAELTAWLAERNVLLRELRVGAAGLEEVFLELIEDES
jgi:ABC-2 type transport system ATP-binding protein